MIEERAPAKVNLVLHVGPPRADGLHPICSLFASLDLADRVVVERVPGGADRVVCPGVTGPNLAAAAVELLREAIAPAAHLPALDVRIDKRVPVAAGLGGGSADAAAVLRAANELAGRPCSADELRRLGARLGADVPSQVTPAHAVVTGAGETVDPVGLPAMALVLAPQSRGLSTAAVYREADRIGGLRKRLDPEALRDVAGGGLEAIVAGLENDLEPAALSLRPELGDVKAALRSAGALGVLVTGSGPTVVGVFPGRAEAERASETLPGALVAEVAPP